MESQTRGEQPTAPTPAPARPAPSEFTAADFVELPPQPLGYSTLPNPPELADDMGPATDPESDPENDVEEKGGWTVALLCAGIAIIACCLLLPLAEDNHQLAYQREKLKLELVQIKQQVEVNAEFLRRVADDPTLAERLARRQMRISSPRAPKCSTCPVETPSRRCPRSCWSPSHRPPPCPPTNPSAAQSRAS